MNRAPSPTQPYLFSTFRKKERWLIVPKQDHTDALTLVTVNDRLPLSPSPSHPTTSNNHTTPAQQNAGTNTAQNNKSDDDLRRAKELVDLHQELKNRHAYGTVDEELGRAREGVNRVLRELSASGD